MCVFELKQQFERKTTACLSACLLNAVYLVTKLAFLISTPFTHWFVAFLTRIGCSIFAHLGSLLLVRRTSTTGIGLVIGLVEPQSSFVRIRESDVMHLVSCLATFCKYSLRLILL